MFFQITLPATSLSLCLSFLTGCQPLPEIPPNGDSTAVCSDNDTDVGMNTAPPQTSGSNNDSDTPSQTQTASDCIGPYPLRLGRCIRTDTGGNCWGEPNEQTQYVALSDNDEIPIVRGHQGSTMLVFFAKTPAIHPGDPTDPAAAENPVVTIDISLDGSDETMGWFKGRVPFDGAAGQEYQTVNGMFVIVDDTVDQLVGQAINIEANVEDRDGQARCSQLTLNTVADFE